MSWLDRLLGRTSRPKFDAVEQPAGEARLHAVPTIRDADGKVKLYQEYFVDDDGTWTARVYCGDSVLERSGKAADRRAAAVAALAWCDRVMKG